MGDDYVVTSITTSSTTNSDTDFNTEPDGRIGNDNRNEYSGNSDDDLSISSNDLETPLLSNSPSLSPSSRPTDKMDDNPHLNPNPSVISNTSSSTTTSSSLSRTSPSNNNICNMLKARLIPALVASSDILSGLAAGMSVRYFPIFFLENLKLSPRIVQAVFLASTISMAILGQVAQKLSGTFGRIQTTIFLKWFGAFMFISMVMSYQNGAPRYVVCILWVVRTASVNATGALTRSVLMDNVKTEERAKWSALESVNMFGWAGSAAIGGYLVDWQGIVFNFYLTASFQLVATIPIFFILGKGREVGMNGGVD